MSANHTGPGGRLILGVLTLAMTLCWLPAAAVAEVNGDVEVVAEEPMPIESWYGYAEYRFLVTNRSLTRAHEVSIQIPAHGTRVPRGHRGAISRTATLQPGQSAMLTLYQSSFAMPQSTAGVRVDGVRSNDPVFIGLREYGGRYGPGGSLPCVLVGPGFDLDSFTRLSEEFHFVRNDTGHWSSSWLGYSGYAGVVLSGDELAAMAPEERAALYSAARCGTALAVVGLAERPADLQAEVPIAGTGSFAPFGFGRLRLSALPRTEADQGLMDDLADDWLHASSPWRSIGAYSNSRPYLPVIDELGIPIRSLFLLIAAFVAVIGPVNLLVLRRKGRMMWLLWTIPAISAATAGGLLIWAGFVEGWTPYVRCESLTLVDQIHQNATSLGTMSLYAPVAPRQGLHFPVDMELTPIRSSWRVAEVGEMDWSSDQHLGQDWIPARVPVTLRFRRASRCRERLGVERLEDGKLEVVNGLGTAISQLRLVGRRGEVHAAGQIAAGARVTLEPSGETSRQQAYQTPLMLPYDQGWEEITEVTWAQRTSFFRPGTYVALVETNPFVPVGLEPVKRVRNRGVIVGIWEEAEDHAR